MDMFWQHGYEGASIVDLTWTTGISPQSRYGILYLVPHTGAVATLRGIKARWNAKWRDIARQIYIRDWRSS